jgi:DNA-binding PadR family transcriptional regulator
LSEEYLRGADADMSTLEYHVLLAMADGPLYGYAIKDAVEHESAGALTPRAGSLYRVLARLMASGLVAEAEPAEAAPPHPGLARKYYGLTGSGRAALAAEARRLKGAAALAEERLRVAEGRP